MRGRMDFAGRLKRDLVGRADARFVYLNNFEVERSWSVGEPKLPGSGIAFANATVNRMEEMGVLLAEAADVVVLKAPMDEEYDAYLHGIGAAAGHVLTADDCDPSRTVTEDALSSPELLQALRNLADGNTYLMPLGISRAEERLAQETGLPLAGPSAAVCTAVNGKIYSRGLVESTGLRAVPGEVCVTVGELPDALHRQLARGTGAVVKESLGVSGRGMIKVANDKAAARLLRLIGRRGADSPANLVVESWVAGAEDLNYQFVVGRSGVVRFETVKAAVLRNGVHQGHRFPAVLSEAHTAELTEAAQLIGKQLYADGYTGMVGVDAMLSPYGTLYPCLEINARFNMSTYQSRITERLLAPGMHGIAATINLRPSRAHTFGEVADALGDLLFDGTGRTGVLVNNFATLNAAAAEGSFHGRLYAVCLDEGPENALALRTEAELRLQKMVESA
ncbi:carbamoylphosphate synthase large subunit [Streptomyces sp. NPDC002790]|uniref:preATP grasp domain-containing protein n=1 Tax=Streptomyces sp. NPDC002790 TaxID=3154431 RepID=UPI003330BD35